MVGIAIAVYVGRVERGCARKGRIHGMLCGIDGIAVDGGVFPPGDVRVVAGRPEQVDIAIAVYVGGNR